jgi:hypothetical protein
MIACICLQERPDRFALSQAEFHRTGLCGDVFYFRPTKQPLEHVNALGFQRADAFGSWESHRHVASRALSVGAFDRATQSGAVPAMLVFEDDVMFVRPVTRSTVARLLRQIARLPPDWDMLLLGHIPFPVPGFSRPLDLITDWQIWRVRSLMLHAYVLSERGARKLAAAPYQRFSPTYGLTKPDEHFLDLWLQHNAVQYAVVPMLCGQADTPSDQNSMGGKQSGIRLHTRLVKHAPYLLETTLMVLPLVTLLVLAIATVLFLLYCLRPSSILSSPTHTTAQPKTAEPLQSSVHVHVH